MSAGFVPGPENFLESLNACFLASGDDNTHSGYRTGLSVGESFTSLVGLSGFEENFLLN